MPSEAAPNRAVKFWLCAIAALIFATVVVGGATRLTESGLSIVEWRPVTGTVPPLSQQDWQAEFEKYKAIPQFSAINSRMSLDDFKTIYWWEWTHRLLGRLIGAAFLLPFLWFLWRGGIARPLGLRLWGIFALGGLQGAVGWWMVSSGLADRISVSPYRLGFHLTLACVIYAAVVWTARGLGAASPAHEPRRLRWGALAMLGLVLLQIYVGALVAGLDAGFVYNTWPLIDGAFVPASEKLLFLSPAWRNVFENDLTVQLLHRVTGYLLLAAAVGHALHSWNVATERRTRNLAFALAGLVTLQAAIGVATLLYVVPIGLALLHQAGALVVLTIAVVHTQRLAPQRQPVSELSVKPAVRSAG